MLKLMVVYVCIWCAFGEKGVGKSWSCIENRLQSEVVLCKNRKLQKTATIILEVVTQRKPCTAVCANGTGKRH